MELCRSAWGSKWEVKASSMALGILAGQVSMSWSLESA
jgi:hypothetical protein